MKKLIILILVFTIICSFVSCKKEEKSAFTDVGEQLGWKKEGCTLYTMEQHPMEKTLLQNIYGDGKHVYTEFEDVENYAVLLCKKSVGYEIHVLKSAHLSKMKSLKKLLYKRLELLQSAEIRRFMGEEYYDYIASAELYEKGCYEVLLITENNEMYKKILEDFIDA